MSLFDKLAHLAKGEALASSSGESQLHVPRTSDARANLLTLQMEAGVGRHCRRSRGAARLNGSMVSRTTMVSR